MKTLNLPDSVIEELSCSFCKSYLSIGPVRVLPDGTCICGRCFPLNSDETIRVLPLEALLSQLEFPCRFNRRGCDETVRFGQVTHEGKCVFRSFPCPMTSLVTCTWNGSVLEIVEHLKKTHPEVLANEIEFKIKIGEDVRGILATSKDGVGFLMKYVYDSAKKRLQIDARSCILGTHDGFYKMKIINGLDADCTVTLKSTKSSVYEETFLDELKSVPLDLGKYLESLERPTHVTFMLYFNAMKQIVHPDVKQELITSLRCEKCQDYLVPPLYDLDQHVICGDCVSKHPESTLSNNTKLQKLVTEISYPCRWRECSYTGPSDTFRQHELNCQFRYYDCFFPKCPTTFKLNFAIEHFRTHRAEYLPDTMTYKISFANPYNVKQLFTVKSNIIALVQHSMVMGSDGHLHRVALFCSNPTETVGSIIFEHQHCKLKSKTFILLSDHNSEIVLSQLPPCFRPTDELFVFVNIEM